jgi:hypothetical protein
VKALAGIFDHLPGCLYFKSSFKNKSCYGQPSQFGIIVLL